MGSLSSSRKIPASTPQVVYVPQAVTQATTATQNSTQDTAADAGALRKENLLARNRGRFGTVLTGFRGFLSAATDGAKQRKTLLGE